MALHEGTSAPDFETVAVDGTRLRLREYAGQPVFLAFFRNAACALCNLRVHHMIERFPAWQAQGLAVITVFESPHERIVAYGQQPPFPIIADPAARLYDIYEVETSESKLNASLSMAETQAAIAAAAAQGFTLTKEEGSNFHRMPADFLIGPDQTIRVARYANFVTDHLPFETIDEYLETLKLV